MWVGGYRKILSKINRRLCAHFKIESLHDPKVNEIAQHGALADAEAGQGHRIGGILRPQADAESALLHAAVLARTDLDKLLRQYARRRTNRNTRQFVKARIAYMVDEACLIGYRWGRAEADLHMKPLAEGGLRSRTAAPKGGRESGARRRKKAETTWQRRALKWAQEERKANPAATKETIVGAMRNRETETSRLPGDRTLMDFLREKEAAGEIPARQKKTRMQSKKKK
jgi:hypothetical protein